MKLNAKFLTAAVLTASVLTISVISPANAGLNIGGKHGVCLGFGCEGDPIFGGKQDKENWERVGRTPQYVSRLCEQVGPKCAHQTFIQTYQALRAGKMAGMYQNQNDCVNTGYAVSQYGHQAASQIAQANGAMVPGELINLSQQMNNADIVDACRVLFQG